MSEQERRPRHLGIIAAQTNDGRGLGTPGVMVYHHDDAPVPQRVLCALAQCSLEPDAHHDFAECTPLTRLAEAIFPSARRAEPTA
jgi:hypothetical protein